MSFLLQLDASRNERGESALVDQIMKQLEVFERDIAAAEPIFQIEGARLEPLARDLPRHQAYYQMRSAEARQLIKWLEADQDKIIARCTRNVMSGQRALGVRETNILVAGEREVVEHKQLMAEINIQLEQLNAIVESLQQMGWMITNIVKLRVASLQDVIL